MRDQILENRQDQFEATEGQPVPQNPLKGEELSPLRGALGRVRRDGEDERRDATGRPARPPRRLLRPRHARDPRQLELGFAAPSSPASSPNYSDPSPNHSDPSPNHSDPTPDASDVPSSEAARCETPRDRVISDPSSPVGAQPALTATAASPTAVARIQPASPRAGSSSSSPTPKSASSSSFGQSSSSFGQSSSSFGLARAALASSFESDALAADLSNPVVAELNPTPAKTESFERAMEWTKNAWMRVRSFLAPTPEPAESASLERSALLVPIDGSRPRPAVGAPSEAATLPWAEQVAVWGGVLVLLALAFVV